MEVELEGRTVSLTNLDRVMFPEAGFTKADVVDYYVRVADAILPHLRGRPLTLRRFPNGVGVAARKAAADRVGAGGVGGARGRPLGGRPRVLSG